jgi:hypothetical protein
VEKLAEVVAAHVRKQFPAGNANQDFQDFFLFTHGLGTQRRQELQEKLTACLGVGRHDESPVAYTSGGVGSANQNLLDKLERVLGKETRDAVDLLLIGRQRQLDRVQTLQEYVLQLRLDLWACFKANEKGLSPLMIRAEEASIKTTEKIKEIAGAGAFNQALDKLTAQKRITWDLFRYGLNNDDTRLKANTFWSVLVDRSPCCKRDNAEASGSESVFSRLFRLDNELESKLDEDFAILAESVDALVGPIKSLDRPFG